MSFGVGLVVGLVAGGFLVVIARQASRGALRPNATVATACSVLALVLAIIAIARSGQNPSPGDTGTETRADVTTTTTPASPSSTTTVPDTVAVPNVVGLTRAVAVSQVAARGLRPDVGTLPLANVPPGYVVSQSPLAASQVPPGTTVALVVSSPA